MWDFLKALTASLFGPKDEDPMGAITADQLAIVLKSIEDKYASLRDDNARLLERLEESREDRAELLDRIEAHQREIERLQRVLTVQVKAEATSDEDDADADTEPPAWLEEISGV
ncbi:MAG: hypothetical protein VKP62_05855 [Candidatus Sericytochromatia bacterium]|nr:hypothetical protein [Candidatus Sericytochromatia bacterium]